MRRRPPPPCAGVRRRCPLLCTNHSEGERAPPEGVKWHCGAGDWPALRSKQCVHAQSRPERNASALAWGSVAAVCSTEDRRLYFCELLGFQVLQRFTLAQGPEASERPTMSLTPTLQEVFKTLTSTRGFHRVLEKVLEARLRLVMKGEEARCLDKYLASFCSAMAVVHLSNDYYFNGAP